MHLSPSSGTRVGGRARPEGTRVSETPIGVRLAWRAVRVTACAAVIAGALTTASASASHFRGSNVSWTTSAGNQADVSFTGSFARSYPGSDPDGGLAVGDEFDEFIGGTTFAYGDGAVNSQRFRTIAVNKADNFVLATMVDDTLNQSPLRHLYAASGPWNAGFSSCCNIGGLNNNAGAFYGDNTEISFAAPNSASPVSSLAPIVDVGPSGVQSFPVPAVDPLGRTLRWSLTDPAESFWTPPAGLAINPNTGFVSWDTTGVPIGLWSVSVSVDALVGGNVVASTTVNFLIRITNTPNDTPVFVAPTPSQGQVFSVDEGSPLSIPVKATDDDAGDTVHIDHLGLPAGAALTAADGNPATATFDWTPPAGSAGSYLVSFTAQDDKVPPGSAVPRTITIEVARPVVGKVSIKDVSVKEGDTGFVDAIFALTLDSAVNQPVTVKFDTADGTAVAPGDYTAASGTVTFAANDTAENAIVKVRGDTVDEPDETFTVTLSAPTGATIDDGTAVGTIVDDDRNGAFSCRAAALRLTGLLETVVANGPDVPCRDASAALVSAKGGSGSILTTLTAPTASTDQTPNDLASQAPAVGDSAMAHADTAAALVSLGVSATATVADAAATCRSTGTPALTTSGKVVGLRVNGRSYGTLTDPVTIPLLLATLRVNATVNASGRITRRAVWLDNAILPDVVIGEASAGHSGNPCAS